MDLCCASGTLGNCAPLGTRGSEITGTWEFRLEPRASLFVLLSLSPSTSPPLHPMDSTCYGRAGLNSQPGNTHRPWFRPQLLPLGLRSEPPCSPSLNDGRLLGCGAHDPTWHHGRRRRSSHNMAGYAPLSLFLSGSSPERSTLVSAASFLDPA